MRLPYLQVTAETWDNARQLAALLDIGEGDAFMALCALWKWGLELGDQEQAPTGICDNPRADRLLAAALGLDTPATELTTALADLGLIERLEVGVRVRGIDRYKRTWEKNRRKPARVVPETGTNPAPPAPEPAPQMERKTQTQTEIPPLEVEDPPPPPKADNRTPFVIAPPPADKPLEAWDGPDFYRWAMGRRQASGLFAEKWPHPSRLSAWWSSALMAGATVPRLKEAYYRFGDDAYWKSKTPPWPFQAFMTQWPDFIPPEDSRAAR